MTLTLDNFTSEIDDSIVARGKNYYEEGLVENLEEVHEGKFAARVHGTEAYRVRVELDKRRIREYSCSCPYDLGIVCKHCVAVFFTIRSSHGISPTKKKKATAGTKKTVRATIAEIFAKLSRTELEKILSEKLEEDLEFRDAFLLQYEDGNDQGSIKEYRQKIHDSLRRIAGGGRYFYIEYRSAHKVTAAMEPFLEKAEGAIEKEHFNLGFCIAAAMVEELTKALQYADDSDGSVGSPLGSALGLIERITKSPLKEQDRQYILGYCLEAFSTGLFKGWDWHIGMLRFASRITQSESEVQLIRECGALIRDSDWDKSEFLKIQLDLIGRFQGKEAQRDFRRMHLSVTEFRLEAIDEALASNDFEEATRLANEGIAEDSEKRPGLVHDWRHALFEIGRKKGDRQATIDQAKYLFADWRGERELYYAALKKEIGKNQWSHFLDSFLTELSKGDYRDQESILWIYIHEMYWDRLFAYVQRKPDLFTLEAYLRYLKKDYAAELAALYVRAIRQFFRTAKDRRDYGTGVRYLSSLAGLGEIAQAQNLARLIIQTFPQRPALRGELTKFLKRTLNPG